MKTKPVNYSLGLALLCAFVSSTALAQKKTAAEVLPKPEQAFGDAKIGRTYKDSKPGTMGLSKAPAGAPNVLIILIDDSGFGQWSTFGGQVPTPNLDRLAKMGLRYTRFHTTALCSPSRASILSGLYAHSHGVRDNFTEYPNNLPSFPRALHDAGYTTGYIGKYHMGEENDEKRPGFDYFVTHKGQGKYWDTEFNVDGKRQLLKGYYTHVVTDLADKWIRKSAAGDKPFLLMLGHKAPHSFYFPEPKYEHALDKFEVTRPDTIDDYDAGKPEWLKESVPTWHGVKGPLYGQKERDPWFRLYRVRRP